MSTTLKSEGTQSDILIISGHSKGAATVARRIDEMKVNVLMIAMTHCEAAKVQENSRMLLPVFLSNTVGETLSKSTNV